MEISAQPKDITPLKDVHVKNKQKLSTLLCIAHIVKEKRPVKKQGVHHSEKFYGTIKFLFFNQFWYEKPYQSYQLKKEKSPKNRAFPGADEGT